MHIHVCLAWNFRYEGFCFSTELQSIFLITGRVRRLHVTMETSVAIHQPITVEQKVLKKLTGERLGALKILFFFHIAEFIIQQAVGENHLLVSFFPPVLFKSNFVLRSLSGGSRGNCGTLDHNCDL